MFYKEFNRYTINVIFVLINSIHYRELTENKKTKSALEKELKEAKLSVELSAKQELMEALEEAQRTAQEEREQLLAQIEDLRLKLRQAEEEHLG